MLRRESDSIFNVHAISFLTVAVFLTVFSVAYGDWYQAKITGHEVIQDDEEIESVEESESTRPPAAVVEEVSQRAEDVRGSARYADSVSEIISTKPLSETELLKYKYNLEEAKKNAVDAFQDTYDLSNKYNSFILSEYQEDIAIDLATIERKIRDIDSILTETVEERFEKQTRQAVWTLEHEEDVENSILILESYLAGMATLGDTSSVSYGDTPIQSNLPGETTGQTSGGETTGETTTQGEQPTYTESDLRIVNPGIIYVPYQGATQLNIRIENHNPSWPLTNCVISPAGQNTAWLSWQPLFNPVYNGPSLGPGQHGIFSVTISPGSAPVGNYLINFRVYCTQEQDGMMLQVQIESGISGGGQTGSIQGEDLTWLLENYPLHLLNPICSGDLETCSSEFPNTCGDNPIFYDCAVNQNCEDFEELCSPTYISNSQMQTFISNYVAPFYDLPYQCIQDIQACSTNSLYCPSYIYECAVEGSCDEYLNTCIYAGSTQSGAGGYAVVSGGGSSSSTTSATQTTGAATAGVATTAGITTEPTIGDAFLDVCRGDARCLSLVQVCYPVSSFIATSKDFVDIGDKGFNPVTGKLCQIGPSLIYLSGSPGKPGTILNQFSGNTEPSDVGNSAITIHFQNSLDGSRRNFVAAVVYSLNGHLTLNFLSSPDYNDLEDKIYEFIQNLLYGEGDGSYITGMSLQQAEEIVSQSTSIPWVLWIILFVMVVCFVLFGNTLSPYNERLISSGKKALSKNDYALAIQNYNALASSYSDDVKVKQDALEYLKQIKERLGSSKINLEFAEKGELPKIKTNSAVGVFSDYSRVQKMIEHALHDLKNNPKLAKSRMHLISEEYRRLTPKDKEKLASSYESLVYKIRRL